MLLLDTTNLQLCEFRGNPPPYATFSATWNDEDVWHEDLRNLQLASQKPGFHTLQRACTECQSRELKWLWTDAVCIDRRSSAAISESLNSLAAIYRASTLCIVYLHDVLLAEDWSPDIDRSISGCNWTKNVWMLPHLVFPRVLNFYDQQWTRICSKSEAALALSRVTSIDEAVLEDSDSLEDVPHSTKMMWASRLTADRIEDVAYSLLGIFNVNMPVIYGEDMKSFLRLQEEILKDTSDYSLLAWQPHGPQQYRGAFGHSPMDFSHLSNKVAFTTLQGELQLQSDGIHIQGEFANRRGDDLLLPLHSSDGRKTWVVLSPCDNGFARNCTENSLDNNECLELGFKNICVRRDVSLRLSDKIAAQRNAQQQEQSSISLCSGESSTFDPIRRTFTGDSYTAWSADAVSSEVPHPLTRLAQASACSVSQLDGMAGCFIGGSAPSALSSTPSQAAATPTRAVTHSSQRDTCEVLAGIEFPYTLEPGHPFTTVIGDLTKILVGRFLSICSSRPGKRAMISWPQKARKRPRLAWSDAYMDVELASDSEDVDTVVVRHAGARTSTFACPFYLMNKARYQECLTRHELSTIEEVKEHLWLTHRRPNFCPICKDIFPTMKASNDHIRERNCKLQDEENFDGLTDVQIQQLERRGSTKSSKETQWFEVWDIVSPPEAPAGPRPLSPYYSNEQEFRIVALRQFWEANGQTIISDFLREKDLQGWEVSNEERSLDILYQIVLHDAIDEVFIKFAEQEEGRALQS